MAPRLSLVARCEERSGGGRGGKNENKFSTISSSPANKQIDKRQDEVVADRVHCGVGFFWFCLFGFYHTMFQKPDCAVLSM